MNGCVELLNCRQGCYLNPWHATLGLGFWSTSRVPGQHQGPAHLRRLPLLSFHGSSFFSIQPLDSTTELVVNLKSSPSKAASQPSENLTSRIDMTNETSFLIIYQRMHCGRYCTKIKTLKGNIISFLNPAHPTTPPST